MKLIISHISAFEYWRETTRSPKERSSPDASFSLDGFQPDARAANPLGLLSESAFSHPLHLLASKSVKRRKAWGEGNVICHSSSKPLPRGAFTSADDLAGEGSLVSCPELCFLQIAALLPFAALVKAGFELCGSYALSRNEQQGFRTRDPLTSVRKIEAFLQMEKSAHGARKARQALAFVLPFSASPMETCLAMLLSLPCARGGYGLGKPLLNHRIDLDANFRGSLGRAYCVADLFWPDAKLDVEYDSDAFHTGADRIARDARRRNRLAAAGISLVTVTRAQMFDRREMDETARIIAKRLGRRIQPRVGNFLDRQLALRTALLGRRW